MTFPADLDLDRWAGVLLGLAAGDALGAGYEFAAPPRGDARMIGGVLAAGSGASGPTTHRWRCASPRRPPPGTSTLLR
jgi:hypothetical protein